MRENRLRLAILGLGSYFRYAYLQRLRVPDSGFEVTALCQRNRTALEAIAPDLGVLSLYTDWEELLTHPGLDAVLISTPHHLHDRQVRAALERGLHVLVDKPICLDAEQAEALIRLAQDKHRILSVAYNYHYWSHFQAARERVRSGRIGRVTSATCFGCARAEGSPILDPTSWYHDPSLAGGGSLVSGGTHRLEAVFWLTGLAPQTLYARMAGPRANFDYQTAITVDLANGAVATVLNEAQGPEWRLEITIFGETGAIFIRNRELFVLDQRGERLALASLPPDSDALTDFHAAVVEGRPLLTTPEDGYWAVAAVQAAYTSAASGAPVKVRPFTSDRRNGL